jgi:hypothetical protein
MMRPKQFGVILLIFTAVSCSRQQKMQRDQQNYDVVQEGATGTATTTLAAPGETAPPPATATNVDTTTAFTLPETATTTSTAPPGTVAGSLPTSTGGSIGQYTPQPRPVVHPRVVAPPMSSSTSTTAPPATDTVPPKTDTAQPPPTATTATSTQGLI